METPTLVLLGESVGYWDQLRAEVLESKGTGPRVHDARVAALCLHHGVDEWSADHDFGRFAGLKVSNRWCRDGTFRGDGALPGEAL